MKTIHLCSLLWLVTITAASGDEIFHPAVQLQAAEQTIDVEREGLSAPFVGDFDEDGVRDLLVGQYFETRLRIYRNQGSNAEPKFADFNWFKSEGKTFELPNDRAQGFTPQLIDLNGDGRTDLLTGTYPLGVRVFLRNPDGTFARETILLAEKVNADIAGQTSTAFAVDWDGDGDLDLLLGHASGPIHVARGEKQPLRFGRLEPLAADGMSITVLGGGAAPVAADWNGDGRIDLIVGDGSGCVHWYRNTSTTGDPVLAAPQQLLSPDPAGHATDNGRRPGQWGTYTKPCVVDWNGDGRMDLLVGDRCLSFNAKPRQTPEEQQEEQTASENLPRWRRAWVEAFAAFQQEMKLPTSDENRLAEKRKRVVELNEKLTQAQTVQVRYQKQQQSHGYVWLFLRK